MNNNKPAVWRLIIAIVSFLPILFIDAAILFAGISGESDVPGFFIFSLFYLAHFVAFIIDFISLVSERRYYSHEMFKANHRGLSVTAGVLLCFSALINFGVWLVIAFGSVFDEVSTKNVSKSFVVGFCTVIMFLVIAQTIIMAIYDFKQPKFMPMYAPYGMPQNGYPYGMPQQPMQNGYPYGMPQQPMQNGNPYGVPQQQPMQNGNPYGMPQQQSMQNVNPYSVPQNQKKSILEKEQYNTNNESPAANENPYSKDETKYAFEQSDGTIYASEQNEEQ